MNETSLLNEADSIAVTNARLDQVLRETRKDEAALKNFFEMRRLRRRIGQTTAFKWFVRPRRPLPSTPD